VLCSNEGRRNILSRRTVAASAASSGSVKCFVSRVQTAGIFVETLEAISISCGEDHMSKASEELEQKTDGDVPTADELTAATVKEAGETIRRQRQQIEAGIRRDPLRSVAIAAGAGFVAALVARRL
jgi:ElaB/YqjD/DUF883 family membrane-anchored ribosome-binding protein